MKTRIKAAVIICALLVWAVFSYYRNAETHAQNQPQEPYKSANQQQEQFPTSVNLECTGCHGPGKSIPNLGGEKFHNDAHGALEASIHETVKVNGRPAASCKDCHAVNGDMTTVFAAEDPKSTVNRANMARTCGACHQSAANSFQHSLHGNRREAGADKAASCADCHGSHGILPAREIGSLVNRAQTAESVCIKCHSDKVHDYASTFGSTTHRNPIR